MTDDNKASAVTWMMGLVAAVVVASIAWYLNSNDARFERINNGLDAVLQTQTDISAAQTGMQKDIAWIKVGMSDIYTTKDAENAHGQIQKTTDDLYDKYESLDQRMSIVEKEQRSD